MEKLPWDAAAYDGFSRIQEGEWGRRMIARLNLRGDETVLDAGCGTGRLLLVLAEALPRGRVLAVDFSGEMLGGVQEAARGGRRLASARRPGGAASGRGGGCYFFPCRASLGPRP